jgi:hypothetical protein
MRYICKKIIMCGVFHLLHPGLLEDEKDYWNIFGDVAKIIITHVSSLTTQSLYFNLNCMFRPYFRHSLGTKFKTS